MTNYLVPQPVLQKMIDCITQNNVIPPGWTVGQVVDLLRLATSCQVAEKSAADEKTSAGQ